MNRQRGRDKSRGRPRSKYVSSDRSTIGSTTNKTNRAIDHLNTRIDRSLGGFTASVGKAITALKTEIGRLIGTPSLDALAANAARVQATSTEISRQSDAIGGEVAAIAASVDDLAAGLPAPVQNAQALAQNLGQVLTYQDNYVDGNGAGTEVFSGNVAKK